MVTKIKAISLVGIEGVSVDVEVDLYPGLPAFYIIGLPDKALQDAVFRVSSAIKNSGYKFPQGKIIVNLAPANLLKSGTSFDFAIALGVLAVSKQIKMDISNTAYWGELSLDGSAKFSKGTLPAVCVARDLGFENLVIPHINAEEAGIVAGIKIKTVKDLRQMASNSAHTISGIKNKIQFILDNNGNDDVNDSLDFSQIKGQEYAKRALEISASGGHNIIMSGPPGSGKTMLSKAMNTILPPLEIKEALEITKLYSVAGLLSKEKQLISKRPFRSPHHTTSKISMVGGGYNLKPGEISLAHLGVLFLDEMNEFSTDSLDVLRQPMEEKKISVIRVSGSVIYPADFLLLGAINPCKCGYYLDENHNCTCSMNDIHNYRKKISGPIMDRMDIMIYVKPMPKDLFTLDNSLSGSKSEKSKMIQKLVAECRRYQNLRSLNLFGKSLLNASLNREQILATTSIGSSFQKMIDLAVDKYELSTRGLIRILRVARTISDMEKGTDILEKHFLEALGYRMNEI